jgi:hypothetical protein
MKTSNILMILAVFILISTLIAYDFGLRAEYLTMKKLGMAKYHSVNRFNGYDQVKVNSFDSLELLAANTMNVTVEFGDKEAVWISKRAKDRVEIFQSGKNLILNLNKKKDAKNYDSMGSDIVIISTDIKGLKLKAFLLPERKKGEYTAQFATTVKDYVQDSLKIDVAANTKIWLNNNQLRSLDARVGDNSGDGDLSISSDNNIESLKLQTLNKSTVEVLDLDIKKLDYDLSEGATVSFRGKILPKLNKLSIK